MNLKTPVREADRIFKNYASRLEKLGIKTLEDFLYHIPFRYEDYSVISKISQVQPGEIVTIKGKVVEIKNVYTKNFKKIQKAKVTDETGIIDIIWFNQPFLVKYIKKDDSISLSGKITWFLGKIVMQSPDYESSQENTIHTGRLVPIYSETRGVSSKWLRRQIYKILGECRKDLLEYLPYSIIEKGGLMGFSEAIEQIHFPKDLDSSIKARSRLSFDELFLLQTASFQRRKDWQNLSVNSFTIAKHKNNIEKFWEKLPFVLTNAQKRAVKEIFADLAGKKPMNRLLEGDVGSGKTVVSAIAMYLAFLNGFQSVLMAPTEILAQQHYKTISKFLIPFGVKVDLATGGKKTDPTNDFDILIGTHAVLSDKINFNKLGLAVIDEQQRFGVEQRAMIRKKGKNPHLLTMTATPIPRTVALTFWGDLDLSYLDEMPKGRRKVKTWLVPSQKREAAYEWIRTQIKNNNSGAFIICPFIEESETLATIKAAKKEYERLKKDIFTDLKLGLLHGKLKSKEKDIILEAFRAKKIDLLVATPVVEVGIDISNATIIVIEAAERFGLAQLHQLRGRVGRGEEQSYCLLFTDSANEKTIQRLKALETVYVGANLAELDLKLRGSGEIYGTMQHGVTHLKIASFSNFSLIERAKIEAKKIFSKLSAYPKLEEKLKEITVKTISPD